MPGTKANPKQIEDPENEGEMIDNPDYDDSLDEEGNPIEKDDLKPIKDKLDKAYGERDTLKNELKELKKQLREAELQKLKDEGKEKEHFEGVIADLEDTVKNLQQEIVELTRDNTVQKVLGGYKFRNKKAAALAASTVTDELVQDDKGKWVHNSGKSIEDYVKAFSEDEDNAFMFEPVENRGTQSPPGTKPGTKTTKSGSLFGRSQQEVLQMAADGKLPKRR